MAKKPKKYGSNVQDTNTLVVDGNALFNLGFHGAKDMYSRDGNHIGGLYQFITVLRKLLREDLFHRVFVFWDGEFSGKQRYKIYKDYKIDRGKDYENGTHPVELDEVMEKFLIRQYLEELCIRQLIDNSPFGAEADDFIAYYCLTKEKNEKITICTSDRDLCQLLNRDVKIYLCDKKIYLSLDNYREHFQHHQKNSKLIKIMGGDNADSIKGITNVKEKTLLRYFPEIKEREVTLNEILYLAKIRQEERINNKKKPLVALTNILDCVTDGIQGNQLYEINERLVDLSVPLLDQKNMDKVDNLKGPMGDMEKRGIKNVYEFMKRDGFDEAIDSFTTSYLMPFKLLIEREKKQQQLN